MKNRISLLYSQLFNSIILTILLLCIHVQNLMLQLKIMTVTNGLHFMRLQQLADQHWPKKPSKKTQPQSLNKTSLDKRHSLLLPKMDILLSPNSSSKKTQPQLLKKTPATQPHSILLLQKDILPWPNTLSKNIQLIIQKNDSESTPLHYAVEYNHLAMAQYIVTRDPSLLTQKNNYGA